MAEEFNVGDIVRLVEDYNMEALEGDLGIVLNPEWTGDCGGDSTDRWTSDLGILLNSEWTTPSPTLVQWKHVLKSTVIECYDYRLRKVGHIHD